MGIAEGGRREYIPPRTFTFCVEVRRALEIEIVFVLVRSSIEHERVPDRVTAEVDVRDVVPVVDTVPNYKK